MREGNVRAALDKRIHALGGETRAVKWLGRRSAPDVLVMLPGRHTLVETKRPGKDARSDQAREHERLRAAGLEVLVINTVEQLDIHFPL